jgi:hypothetical protein
MAVATLLADLSFLLVLLIGWRLLFSVSSERNRARTLLVFGLVFPLVCAMAYLPWPKFDLFYGIPYLLGPALLVALAITGFQKAAPRIAPLAAMAWVWVTMYMASDAFRYVRNVEASVRTTVNISRELARLPAQDTVVVAVCGLPQDAWRHLAWLVTAYPHAEGKKAPPGRDASCDEAKRMLAQDGRQTVVIVSRGDRFVSEPKRTIVQVARRFEWRTLSFVDDTLRAEISSPGFPQ